MLIGPGYDAGVLDIGDGYVVTLHIESHNHPSAIDPYGGAATGIGGVLRDILAMGTRPIGLVDILRFGRIDRSAHSRWLLGNVVRGIADYGNCVGVPTVAGELQFDESFERNCLVDVACVGVGRKSDLILAEAKNPGEILVLAGGTTGRDGIMGAAFASKNLTNDSESERSSVQVPSPFTKKLLMDAILEAAETHLIRGMKDLGGGGLSTALSETASKGGTGVEVELTKVMLREADMNPEEIMTSESQERMLLVLSPETADGVLIILRKYGVSYSVIGVVTSDGNLTVKMGGRVVARLPTELVANAPQVPWSARRPRPPPQDVLTPEPSDLSEAIVSVIGSPNIASRRWVYQQYDHEVGVRTVVKPGQGDAAVLRLPNGRFLAVKGDGNSKHCHLDPYAGASGCVAEACRNVVAVGAEPIAMVDHLQFGNPSDPEVYWSFKQSIAGMADYCSTLGLPVVGGKVSFYNEDNATRTAIKPTPLALVIGLIDEPKKITTMRVRAEDQDILLIGETRRELGGSEYYEWVLGKVGGVPPAVRPHSDRILLKTVHRLIGSGNVGAVHDCSSGGLAAAISEMCLASEIGARLDLESVPGDCNRSDELLFSESHGRFVLASDPDDSASTVSKLTSAGIPSAVVGSFVGRELTITRGQRPVASITLRKLAEVWENSFSRLMGE